MGWSLPFRAPLNEIFRNLLSNDEHDESFHFFFARCISFSSSLPPCMASLALELTFNYVNLEQFCAPLNEIYRNLFPMMSMMNHFIFFSSLPPCVASLALEVSFNFLNLEQFCAPMK